MSVWGVEEAVFYLSTAPSSSASISNPGLANRSGYDKARTMAALAFVPDKEM